MEPRVEIAQRPHRGQPRGRRARVPRHSLRAAAAGRAASARAAAAGALGGRARGQDLRRVGSPDARAPRRAARKPDGDLRGGLSLPERLDARRRRRAPARAGLAPRRRLHHGLGIAADLRRRAARAARRRRRGDDQLPARRARLPPSAGARARGGGLRRPIRACSIRSRRSPGCGEHRGLRRRSREHRRCSASRRAR